MVNIYDENLKHVVCLNYSYEQFKVNPRRYYPDWKTVYTATEHRYNHPTLSEDGVIREMTQEELKIKGIVALEPGEYIVGQVLHTTPYDPALDFVTPQWDAVKHQWFEAASEFEIYQHRIKTLYESYRPLDTHTMAVQMAQQDPALLTEFEELMISLRMARSALKVQAATTLETRDFKALPQPSKELELFLQENI